jgi:hypothetical protein
MLVPNRGITNPAMLLLGATDDLTQQLFVEFYITVINDLNDGAGQRFAGHILLVIIIGETISHNHR